jgi:hypothetical protein
VKLFYSQAAKIGINRNRTADVFPYGLFIYLKVMLAAFGLPRVYDLQTVALNRLV